MELPKHVCINFQENYSFSGVGDLTSLTFWNPETETNFQYAPIEAPGSFTKMWPGMNALQSSKSNNRVSSCKFNKFFRYKTILAPL